jgi:sec-independent protein translocase protein TatB
VFDFGISEMGIIGAVALVVIGPERLPKVARTVGALVGKAQRYVADVKAEVNRSMELEELQKMKQSMTDAVSEIEASARETAEDFDSAWNEANQAFKTPPDGVGSGDYDYLSNAFAYQPVRKNFRLKQSKIPQWYKAHNKQRRHIQSGAARVARFRPHPR